MKNRLLLYFASLLCAIVLTSSTPPQQEYYALHVYELKSDAQERTIDEYLSKALLPALHRLGIRNVGTFKPVEPDTASKKIYLLIPLRSLNQLDEVQVRLAKDTEYNASGKTYLNATYDNPPYTRIQTIILKAFSHQPVIQLPKLSGPRAERIYELRSYEGHTEAIFKNKVEMFNEGGEITLFNRLGFNAIFYGEVISGSRMPNLMYMTSFENRESRDAHWKAFGEDPEWKKLSSMPEYQHNVSKIDITFLRPTDYSDY